jgi:hypothetical protein
MTMGCEHFETNYEEQWRERLAEEARANRAGRFFFSLQKVPKQSEPEQRTLVFGPAAGWSVIRVTMAGRLAGNQQNQQELSTEPAGEL